MSQGSTGAGGRSKGLVLTAMIFAVAMTFIDQRTRITGASSGPDRAGSPAHACSL
jgi:hypothetical protein